MKFYNVLFMRIFLLCLYTVTFFVGSSQSYNPNQIIPPSPTAASLSKYGEFPINYYSGMPNISIPIYSIKDIDNNIDISLRYSSAGTRVGDQASWVGLGWSLNAGGVITRTIRGLDDFKNGGYYSAPILPTSNANNDIEDGPNWPNDRNYLESVLNNTTDGEADIVNYNFGNLSGRFILGKYPVKIK